MLLNFFMKVRVVAFTLFLFLFGFQVQAQTDRVLVDLADEMYAFGDYEDALGVYLQAVLENESNVRANYMVGICYLKSTAEKDHATKFLLKAYELDPEISPNILFEIAEAYRFSNDFDNAIAHYYLFKEEIRTDRRKFSDQDVDKLQARTDRRIEVCGYAKEAVANPVTVRITSLGPVVNSPYDDYAPSLSADNEILIFTSKRSGGVSGLKDRDNKFYEDIYLTTKKDGEWQSPENLGDKVNSEHHDANISLSPDGDRLYIYKTDNNGDIYVSEKVKGEWSKPKPLKRPINSEYRESSVYEVPDGQRLFFTSSRPGGAGGTDIYVAYKNTKGEYESVERLSDVVNTQYDEESPFFDEETNTLYFSSKGHKTIGNFDVFKTVYDDDAGTWSEPENLGYPINSSDDDLYYVLSVDGKTAYFSSYKEDSQGGLDIYKITPYEKEEEEPEPEEEPVVLQPVNLKMNIYDMNTDAPVNAVVKLVDLRTDSIIDSSMAVNGQYELLVNPFKGGGIVATLEADGYLYQTVKLKLEFAEDSTTLSKNVAMRAPKVKQINVLRNIYFGFDQHTLRPASHNELDILTEMLLTNPNMKIEIAGHTDYIGSDEYNYDLSLKRARAVENFLLNKGVPKEQMTVKGYGKTKPMASNDEEKEGRELNRRTEFIILKK